MLGAVLVAVLVGVLAVVELGAVAVVTTVVALMTGPVRGAGARGARGVASRRLRPEAISLASLVT
ncbi:hypothetical protein [Cellulomonas sp. PSBB021]|uniref:hypothetical protein n=1 Tax=Cellulomonas sp. PSBB021 TaxID=2003551 RepID=UPI0012FDEC33|nr:hypothetical protein [Cellulomonas sp. PSBB021]